jgi:hypothetical protein
MAIRLNIVTQFNDKELKRAQRDISNIGKSISSALNYAVAGGLVAATAGITNAIKSASNYAAEFEGVNQVFGDAAKSVKAFADTAAQTAGLSSQEALQASKVFGLFAGSAGVSGEAAAKFSTTLVQLAGDLGSFNDVPTADALAAIQSGLQGQAEPLRKFGVFLTDDALKAEALAMGLYSGTGALDAQSKMLASYNLIMGSTLIQQGDYLKYADTFGNATKTITQELANLQVEIGTAVLPALEAMLPAVRDLIPVLGAQLKAAVESVDWKALFTTLIDGISFLINNGSKIIAFATTVFALGKAFAAFKIVVDLVQISIAILNGTMALNPYVLIAAAVIGLAAAFVILTADAKKANDELYKTTGLKQGQITGRVFAAPGGALPKGDAYARYGALQANADAQAAALKQRRLDAAAARKLAGSVTPVATGVKSGADAVSKAADAAKKALEAQNKAVADAVVELNKQRQAIIDANEEITQAYNDSVESLTKFKTALSDASAGVKPLVLATRDIGQFEQAVISAFDNIADTIKSGLADKTLTDEAAKNLTDYATKEKSVLIAMGKQRDDLFKKRSLAEGLIADVKASIAGLGNITGMVKTEAKMVTQTITQIINGLSVATTRTVEDVAGTTGLVANFQSVLAKTKAFAVQLKELRRLGLDKNLYQQIVDAGVDAGSVTAEEIIAGGAGTITELNTLFDDLNTVGASIAEETAQVMYGAGVDVTKGLVAGLLAEEATLVSAAETLANSFLTAFNSLVANITVLAPSLAAVPDVATVVDGTEKVLSDKLVNLRSRLDTLGTIQGAAEMATAKSLMSQIRSTAGELTAVNPKAVTGVSNTNIVVNVSASAGVNTKKTGQDIANALAKYTGANA